MYCYVVCENHYKNDILQDVNLVGVSNDFDKSKELVKNNRNELFKLFGDHNIITDSFENDDHECSTSYGDVYRTCIVKTKFV